MGSKLQGRVCWVPGGGWDRCRGHIQFATERPINRVTHIHNSSVSFTHSHFHFQVTAAVMQQAPRHFACEAEAGMFSQLMQGVGQLEPRLIRIFMRHIG